MQRNSSETKQLLFNSNNSRKPGHKVPNLLDQAVKNTGASDRDHFARESKKRKYWFSRNFSYRL